MKTFSKTILLFAFLFAVMPIVQGASAPKNRNYLVLNDIMEFNNELEDGMGLFVIKNHNHFDASMKQLGAKSLSTPWDVYLFEGNSEEGAEYSVHAGTRVVYLLNDAQITYDYCTNGDGLEERFYEIEFRNEKALNNFLVSVKAQGSGEDKDYLKETDYEKIYSLPDPCTFALVVNGLKVTLRTTVG